MEAEATSDVCFTESTVEPQLDQAPLKKCILDASQVTSATTGCFDCNICLDFAVEPVVTLCGHLYCWPCIYKWLQQAESLSSQQCPVCKASLSRDTLVPLYGRGHSTKQSHQILEEIPRRPPSTHQDYPGSVPGSPRLNVEHDRAHHPQHDYLLGSPYHGYPYSNHVSPPSSPLRSPSGTRTIHSRAGGVLGGMAVAVLPWVYRNQDAGLYYSNPFQLAGAGLNAPRLRRQEVQVERSLHQIWVFCCCCAVLCLLFF